MTTVSHPSAPGANASAPEPRDLGLLRQRVNRHTVTGLAIAVVALGLASVLSAAVTHDQVNIGSLLEVHRSNRALWALYAIPFVFVLLGQRSGRLLAEDAGTMVRRTTDQMHEQRSRLEEKIAYDASHDHLTDLLNRAALYDHLTQSLEAVSSAGGAVLVLLLDLDRFKEINETLGYFNGDHLLRQLGGRLRAIVHEPSICARIGGDEFAITWIHPPGASPQSASVEAALAERALQIRRALAAPFVVEDLSFELEISVGGAWAPEHASEPHELLRSAEIAMYSAKQHPTGYCPFHPDLDHYNPRRLGMMGDLRTAISSDWLTLHYQPKADIASGRILGAEALLRWPRGTEMVPPDEFIPLAESTRLIKPLTAWVLNSAMAQLAAWRHSEFDLHVAVNLSARDLHDRKLPAAIEALFEHHQVDPSRLMIEITETSIMVDQARAAEVLGELHRLGLRVAIDDFGTGHSSLAYLGRLPVDALKIDRSFVAGMAAHPENETIVTATIDLAHNLGLTVTAEGVECEDTWNRLLARGCDHVQGFYISPALDPPALEALVRANNAPKPRVGEERSYGPEPIAV